MSLESKLAAGTLKLESTKMLVTAAQAKQLLPLWQKIQTLDASGDNANQSDKMAVYQQIEQVMTQDQIQAIQNMNLRQSDIQNLMKAYGIQVTPGAGFDGNFPTFSPEQLATRQALGTQEPSGGNFPTLSPEERATREAGGGFGGGNGGPTLSPDQLATRQAGGGRFRGGFERIFLDALIKVLQVRSQA